jgi:quinol-cytochrome oxidoreductase complex cytochrome b subunit
MNATANQGVLALARSALRAPIPHDLRGDLGMSVLILALFLLQVFTGILLSLYYQPSPEAVSESMQFIMRDVSWGWLLRGLHHWVSSGLILVCCAHLARALWGARYRGREWYWYLGALVMVLVVVLSFTGELLVWDNQAYWVVREFLADLETIPLVGPSVADVVRGGSEVNASTLSRTWTAHALFTPWLVWMLLMSNLALIVRDVRRAWAGGA